MKEFKVGGFIFDLETFNLTKTQFKEKYAGRIKTDWREAYNEIIKAKKKK